MTRLKILAALLGAAALAGCEKNAAQEITSPITGGAFVRFQNYGVGAPGVNFYANGTKITAISSASCTPAPTTPVAACSTTGVESTIGVVYGGSANGGNYARLTPGQYTLEGRIAATVDNGLAVAAMPMTLAEGKYYTYFISGVYNTATKKSDAFVVEDDIPTSFDYTKAYVRLVNASPNSAPVSATIKLQTGTEVVTVATNLAYKSAGQFITVTPGLSDITVVVNGTPRTFTNVNVTGGHVFSLVLRGDATSTVTANQPLITAISHR